MGRVNVHDVKKGMVLMSAVTNKHGNVLLRPGEELTDKSIMLLKSWGITEVDIEGHEGDMGEGKESDGLSPEVLASIEKEVREQFFDFTDNPFMERLCAIVKKSKMKYAAGAPSGNGDATESN